jgi:hypothetical protein
VHGVASFAYLMASLLPQTLAPSRCFCPMILGKFFQSHMVDGGQHFFFDISDRHSRPMAEVVVSD